MRTKRTVLIMTIALTAILVTATVGLSHPPTSLDLKHSADDGVLSISIAHTVGDISTHFVKNVKVTIDGRQAADLFYISQTEKSGETLFVSIGKFKPGTQISVMVECSKFGKLEKKLVH
ncbi:MAG: hypothetical protein Q7I97_07560 [Thermovirgaceae bacterium]|nr:hypothetical protein [Thermovirgaceae bacterium]